MYDYFFFSYTYLLNSITRRGVYKSLASPMRSVFKGGAYFKTAFLKSLTPITIFMFKKSSNFAFFLRLNRTSLDAEDCKVLPSFFFYPQTIIITGACYVGKNKHHILREGCSLLHSRF